MISNIFLSALIIMAFSVFMGEKLCFELENFVFSILSYGQFLVKDFKDILNKRLGTIEIWK